MPAEPGVLARPDREAVLPIAVERRGLRLPLFSLAMIALFVVAALVAPLLSLPDPTAQSLRARFSLAAGVVTVLLASAFGAAVGLAAGYYGGRVDATLMRITDATLSFPVILLALILAVTVGPSFTNVVIAIAVILWARYARVIRGQVLTLMQLDFVAQARLAGAGAWRIITRHLLPNTLGTLLVLVTLQIGYVIIVEASLSFLGAGIPPPTPAWGSMIAEGRDVVTIAWWVSLFPGLAILLVVLAFNLLGDWLRDTFDPKLRQL